MEVFMIVLLSIIALVLLVANIYLLAYYSHPDDKGFGVDLIAKIVMVLGMTLTWAAVLMFPLDVSNARSTETLPFRMDLFWMIIYITIAAFILIIIPICIFYYEADPEWSCVSEMIIYTKLIVRKN